MTTMRTPIRPQSKVHITPEAVAAFRRMERARLRCTCPPVDYEREDWAEQSVDQCVACRRWWDAHSVLHTALGLPPWRWPAVEYPDDENPYPAGCHAAAHWQRQRDERPEALQLYMLLVEASKAARKSTEST
jgi:hypothetical protein